MKYINRFNFVLIFFTTFLTTFFSLALSAYENDAFSSQKIELKDSTEILDAQMNKTIQNTLKLVNETSKSCDKKELRTALHGQLAASKLSGGLIGTFETFAEENLPKGYKIPSPLVKDSIYAGTSFDSAFAVGGLLEKVGGLFQSLKTMVGMEALGESGSGALQSTILVNNQRIGTDKFGHFIDQGYEYYEMNYVKKSGPVTALKSGIYSEENYYGLKSTGIKSHGDLAANYRGMKFWHDLMDENYFFVCDNGKFRQTRSFTFKDYVDAGWDETINCNEYESIKMTEKVNENLKKINLKCPINDKVCADLNLSYGRQGKYVLSPACLKLANSTKSSPSAGQAPTELGGTK